jgi:hypothetical protein
MGACGKGLLWAGRGQVAQGKAERGPDSAAHGWSLRWSSCAGDKEEQLCPHIEGKGSASHPRQAAAVVPKFRIDRMSHGQPRRHVGTSSPQPRHSRVLT